nr:reverse transcriptase [Tanacetum cinerariifolium]
MEQIEKEPASFPYHFIRDGLVYRHGRIMVPPLQQLRARLLQEFHSSPTGGHSGRTVIWVIVDRLSKFAHFIALPTHYTAASLAALFM